MIIIVPVETMKDILETLLVAIAVRGQTPPHVPLF